MATETTVLFAAAAAIITTLGVSAVAVILWFAGGKVRALTVTTTAGCMVLGGCLTVAAAAWLNAGNPVIAWAAGAALVAIIGRLLQAFADSEGELAFLSTVIDWKLVALGLMLTGAVLAFIPLAVAAVSG